MLLGILWAWIMGITCMGIDIPIFTSYAMSIGLSCLIFIVLIQYGLNHAIYKRILLIACSALLSFDIAYFYANQQLQQRLDYQEKQVRTGEVIVYIHQINQLSNRSIFQKAEILSGFQVDKKDLSQPIYWLLRTPLQQTRLHPLLKDYTDEQDLSQKDNVIEQRKLPTLALGQYYRLAGEIRPNHGYANVGSFDSEQWAIQQNLMANFKITQVTPLTADEMVQLGFSHHVKQQQQWNAKILLLIEQKRLAIRQYILSKPLDNKGLILALLTGDDSLLNDETKQLFQTLGISHLLAISGPHVLILAFMLTTLIQAIVKQYYPQLYLRLPRQYFLCLPFIATVLLYTAFVGFEIPALRTLLMSSVIVILLLLHRQLNAVMVLTLSASVLLLIDVFSILSASFWLSFGASFILLRVYQSIQQEQKILTELELAQQTYWDKFKCYSWALWQSQWKIFIALFPLVMIFFQKVSWLSPIVNLIAVPFLGIIIVPLNIIAGLLFFIYADLAYVVWWLIDHILNMFLWLMASVVHIFSLELISIALTPAMIILFIIAVILFFLPKGILPKSWIVLCIFASGLLYINRPQFELSILDVGQGQSIFIKSTTQNILIDTGGYYDEDRFSIGQNVVVPFLLRQGVKQLHQVVLSHLDNDHSGALPYIARDIKIHQVLANEDLTGSEYWKMLQTEQHNIAHQQCYAGQHWSISPYTTIRVYAPEQGLSNSQIQQNRNENSCVIHIQHLDLSGRYANFLIMGDAGYATEQYLMQHYPDIKVDVLILGHHGSKHSTSAEFLDFYKPKLAIASAGFNNRYRHPSEEVMILLKQRHIPLMTTIAHGTIQFKALDGKVILNTYRDTRTWRYRDE